MKLTKWLSTCVGSEFVFYLHIWMISFRRESATEIESILVAGIPSPFMKLDRKVKNFQHAVAKTGKLVILFYLFVIFVTF